MFVNGALIGTRPTSGTIGSATNALNIGRRFDSSYYLDGAISNLRIVKGTAVYTAAFTPSTEPLTAVPGTVLLTAQNRRFQDNSSANRVITPVNTPKVTAQSPFAFTEYNTATMGGSAYFDAVDDFLEIAPITLTGSFTIQAWVYIVPKVSTQYIILFFGTTNHQFALNQASTGISMHDGSVTTYSSAGAMHKYEWNHVAWSRSGTTVRMFINGKQVATTTSNANILITRIGQYYTGGYNMPGYVADAEITSTALYTADFTPPTAPRSAPVAPTRLLLKCTNAGIVDSAGNHNLETVGNAKITTSQFKYGSSAISLPNASYLKAPNTNGMFSFGTGDFTVQCWVTRNNHGNNYQSIASVISDQGSTGNPVGYGWSFGLTTGIQYGVFLWNNNTSTITQINAPTVAPVGVWQHLAAVRSGNTLTLYVDGINVASTTLAAGFNIAPSPATLLNIGTYGNGYWGHYFSGTIDDL